MEHSKWTGKEVRILRRKKNMTQQDFSKWIGNVRQQTISDWECFDEGEVGNAWSRVLDLLTAKPNKNNVSEPYATT